MRAVVITEHGRTRRPAGPGAARPAAEGRARCAIDVARRRRQLRRPDGARRPVPRRAAAAGGRRLRGRRRRHGARARASTASRSATASWPARASAATPRRSPSTPATSSRCPSGCPSRRARRCRSTTRPRGRRSSRYGVAAAGRARARSTPRRAASASRRRRSPSTSAPRSGARRRRPSTRRSARIGVDRALDYRHAGWERDLPPFDVVLDAIGGRSFRTLLRPAAPRRPARLLRRLVGDERREAQPAQRRAAWRCRMPRFNLHQADERVQGGHRPEPAHAVGRPRHARAVDRAAARRCSTPASIRPVVAAERPVRPRAPRRTGCSPSAATSARSCSSA